ncbi:hypothetical protein LL963_10705 [Xanthomonas campestris pv. esculenti]|nr:hypothetical protein [Xanthomonas campestris pv. esculenti]
MGPKTVGGQGPVTMVGAQSVQPATDNLRDAAFSFFNKTTSQLSGVVSSPIAGPLAARTPPSSFHGRIHGVSRER